MKEPVETTGSSPFPSQTEVLIFLKNKISKNEILRIEKNIKAFDRDEYSITLEELIISVRYDSNDISNASRFSMRIECIVNLQEYFISYPPLLNVGAISLSEFSKMIENIFISLNIQEIDNRKVLSSRLNSIINGCP